MTVSPGEASGLAAVTMPSCPCGPTVTRAETGGSTTTSTGWLIDPSGPDRRNAAFVTSPETVTVALPLPPVAALPTGRQPGWPAARSSNVTVAPATGSFVPVSRAVNASLPPAGIRPWAADRLSRTVPAGGGLAEPGADEADVAGEADPPGADEDTAGPPGCGPPRAGWCGRGTPANPSAR